MGETQAGDRSLHGVPMDRTEVDEFLREQGVGVLSLAADGDAYGVPISFGYDGEKLYFFLLEFGGESTKLDFAGETTTATFTAYEFPDKHHWRSVVVRGPIERVPDDRREAADEALFDNGQFASLSPFGEPMTDRPRYQLTVDDLSARQGQGFDV